MSTETTQQEQPLLPEVIKVKDVFETAQANMPRIIEGSKKAIAKMQTITEVTTDEQFESVEALCGNVAKAYEKMQGLRKEVTAPLDAFISWCISFEKQLGPDKNSEYTRVRNLLVKFKQDQLEAKKKVEAEAAKKKQRSDHFVDIEATIKKNLTEMVVRVANAVETNSADYFSKCTLADFDTKAAMYLKGKPNLKQPDYDACFNVQIRSDLYDSSEALGIITGFKAALPISACNEQMIELATPIVNAWRAKIPDLRANLVALAAASDEEKVRLEAEQKAREQAESDKRKAELQQKEEQAQLDLQASAQMSKMENSFVEQATVQEAGDKGPVKLVLRFTDDKVVMKPLAEIIYHTMASKEFPGIYKKDRAGNRVKDANGRDEYRAEIQWWITQFLANCDADVAGTTIEEEAKIQIRK